jgi:hypothetical protein
MNYILKYIRTFTTRFILVRVNVGIQITVEHFLKCPVQIEAGAGKSLKAGNPY